MLFLSCIYVFKVLMLIITINSNNVLVSASLASVPTSEVATESGFSMADYKKVSGRFLFLRQFQALFLKRFHRLRRSKKGFFFEVGLRREGVKKLLMHSCLCIEVYKL